MIIARGRFGGLLASSIGNHSLKEIADRAGVSYEQIRKLILMHSLPSPLLLEKLCSVLGMDLKAAQEAVAADRIQHKYGAAGLKVRGQNPRVAAFEALLPLLSDEDYEVLLAMVQGLVMNRRRLAPKAERPATLQARKTPSPKS